MSHHCPSHVAGRQNTKGGRRFDEREKDDAADPDGEGKEHEESEDGHRKAVLSSQFSVLSSQFSVLSSQFSVLSSQFSVLSSQFSVLSSQFSVLSSQGDA